MATKTPVTTPELMTEDEDYLVPQAHPPSSSRTKPWYCKLYPPPYAILSLSVVEISAYFFWIASKQVQVLFRFDPNSLIQIWRFVTYMFLHNNKFHIILNVVIQCIFSITLEKNQGNLRVGLLYFGSGVIGGLGASCVRPDLVVGASAGVYGLLISHISHITLNYNSSKYKIWIVLAVIIIVVSDVTYYFIHYRYTHKLIISEGAHIGGAIGGFLLGLLLYRTSNKEPKKRSRIIFWFAFCIIYSAHGRTYLDKYPNKALYS